MSASIQQQFTTWVRKQDPDEEYNYDSNNGCALARFLIENGYSYFPMVAADGWIDKSGRDRPLPFPERVLSVWPWTYGAVLDRLEGLAS